MLTAKIKRINVIETKLASGGNCVCVCVYRRVFSRVDEPKDFAGNRLDAMPLSCGDEHQLPELPCVGHSFIAGKWKKKIP